MQPSQGSFTSLLKRFLLRESIKHPGFQRLWSRLHTITIFGMNYGGGGLIENSGETWVISKVVAHACQALAKPIIFDVGANVGDYAMLIKEHLPASQVYAFEPSLDTYRQLEKNI